MTKSKERLIIFMGAGASVAAGIPSTWDLTECVRGYPLTGTALSSTNIVLPAGVAFSTLTYPDMPVFDLIYRALLSRFASPNFEHILAVLEGMTGLASSNLSRMIADDYANVLVPFISTNETYSVLKDTGFLREACGHFIKAIFEKVENAGKSNRHKEMQKFLEALREQYVLSIFTLNYDELVEECEPFGSPWFYDGFDIHNGAPTHYLFNRQKFRDSVNCPQTELLCHMHGSIRYGYSMDSGGFDLVKFDTSRQAAVSLGFGSSPVMSKGDFFTKSPIITGFSKAAKLTYTSIPYGHYFKAFADSLMNHRRLMVIGYGGGDDHVNAWLNEFIEMHGDKRRVIYATPRTCNDIGERTKVQETMQGLSQAVGSKDVMHNDEAHYSSTLNPVEFHALGRLGLCAAGFPLVDFDSTMESIFKFLES